MKKFLLVLFIVLIAIGVLAACAPLQNIDVEEYTRTLPTWVIIVGAIVLFFIGFSIIWKLIPGFIKVIAIIALAAALAGTAYGVWNITWAEKVIEGAEDIRHDYFDNDSMSD